MSERESGIARSAPHTIHVLPHSAAVIARFLGPALERVAADADATQLLVITPDADTTLAIAEAARTLSGGSGAPVVPLTSAPRGGRLLGSRVVPAIAATPSTLVSLLKSSSVKLAGVRTVVIAWADELTDARESETLEIVLSEIPKEASRVVVADRMTPAVEALVERHLRRASRQGTPADEDATATVAIRYVITAESTRRSALRRLLDDLDPPSAIVVASTENEVEARSVVESLGYSSDTLVRVATGPVEEQAALVVFYGLPPGADDVAKIGATEPAQVVALVAPRQVAALRRLTTGAVEPLDISQAAAKARSRDEKLRAALRTELLAGFPAREVMAIEPLLTEFDGLEIAAAAIRLIERERAEGRVRRVEAERPVERTSERPTERAERSERPERGDRPERSEPSERSERAERPARDGGERSPTRSEGGFGRVYLSVGDKDGVRAGDLVGAITGESGITSDRIGKLEIRDMHTIAEIAAADVDTVIEKMNGVSLRGRRISARVDDRPAPRSRESRGPSRDSRGDRKPGGFREGRGAPRAGGRGGFGARDRERPPRDREASGGDRGGRFSRDDRPARGPRREGGFGGGASRGPGGPRGPRRDDDRSRGRPSFSDRDRSNEGRVPRATREREEWRDRADSVRNARRPRRDDA
ncbi:MAG TPA: DbpA RNA binding domain-containing protein [Gemmatimonadaceae bacterium]|nr:DbpA RNA binding domain-containing protein [Gemmatimonadaceae bacterium]